MEYLEYLEVLSEPSLFKSPQPPQPPQPIAPPKQKQARSWDQYATDNKKSEISQLWAKLTGGGEVNEALDPKYGSDFASYVQFYKDEAAKQKAQGGKSFISPDGMIALLKTKLSEPAGTAAANVPAAPQAAAGATAPQSAAGGTGAAGDAITQIAGLRSKEVSDLQTAMKGLDRFIAGGNKKMPREDLSPAIRGLIPATKLGPFKPSYLKGQVEKAIQARQANLEESIINESTYNRWQTLIRN